MKLDLETRTGNLIQSFASGELRVGGTVFTTPVILGLDRIISDWSPPPVEQLALDDLQPVLALDPEVILLGTGTMQRHPTLALTTAVLRLGVGLEIMNTAAACRTFNVLASEYRQVIAVLFID